MIDPCAALYTKAKSLTSATLCPAKAERIPLLAERARSASLTGRCLNRRPAQRLAEKLSRHPLLQEGESFRHANFFGSQDTGPPLGSMAGKLALIVEPAGAVVGEA